jgi:5-methylcytosine-specific restriction endonuclease McrA
MSEDLASQAFLAILGTIFLFWIMSRSDRRRGRRVKLRPLGSRTSSRTIPQDVKIAVSVRDGGKCRICGSTKGLHYDHIVPYSLGGRSDDPDNIQLLCARHNLRKGNRYIG